MASSRRRPGDPDPRMLRALTRDVCRPRRAVRLCRGDRLDVTLSGDGQAQLGQLTARDVQTVVSGSGLIQVTATASLDAAVPGSGSIVYSGNPAQVNTSVTGSGTIARG